MRAIIVLVASLVIGGLESLAQGYLPDWLRPLSNSVSGWTLVTALLVSWARVRPGVGVVLGALSFALLVVGYAVISTWRGHYYSPLMWALIGLVAGPFIGVAASWLRENGIRAALGTGLLAGIGIGDAVFGLTVVADTTGVVYWTLAGILGLLLLGGMLFRRIRGTVPILVLIATTVLIAFGYNLALRLV
ncbi:hypothetical protein HII28_17825 [Planctomonas sp. JC2975]|nr:hypothetical protein [Planctomonas sp. JC2975]